MPRKYFSETNIFIFFFGLAAIAFLHGALDGSAGGKSLLEVIAGEVTRPIGVAVSILAVTTLGLSRSYFRTHKAPTSRNDISAGLERATGKPR